MLERPYNLLAGFLDLNNSQSPISTDEFCPQCASPSAPHLAVAGFNRCRSCSLIFRVQISSPANLDELYEQSWAHPESNRSETGGTESGHSQIYARLLAKSIGVNDFSGLTLCDFGAGRGSMTQALADLGANVLAVEPYGYEFLISKNIKTYRTLADIPEQIRFDGIVSVSVMEHLQKPWQELEHLRAKLKSGGWVYLATPNAAGFAARIARNKWREALRPGHLVLLTPETMTRSLSRAGFTNFKRLKWYVAYRTGARKVLGYALQFTGYEGELRYLAFN